MNFLILGDGHEEQAWAQAIATSPGHRLVAAFPGLKSFPDLPGSTDLDTALAVAEVEAVVAGGGPDLRSEGLRRAAAAGLAVLALHPPGPDPDPYYQVSLSHQETGAVIVPDLPGRLHPGLDRLRAAMGSDALGTLRAVRYEATVPPEEGDLAGRAFARVVDVVRALIGEVEAVLASGDPPGERPTEEVLVQLRGAASRRGEIRLSSGPVEPSRLSLVGSEGSLTLEFDPSFLGLARLLTRPRGAEETVTALEPWDPKGAMLATLAAAVAGRPVRPNLQDGTRALELVEGVRASLRRGRTIDLHYEEISAASGFKSAMTAIGCTLFGLFLIALPVALLGPAFGVNATLLLAYAIPPVLVLFLVVQVVRFVARDLSPRAAPSEPGGVEDGTQAP